jgi:hypothetical protein
MQLTSPAQLPGALRVPKKVHAGRSKGAITAHQQPCLPVANRLNEGVAACRHHRDATGIELSGTQAEGFITAAGIHHTHRH